MTCEGCCCSSEGARCKYQEASGDDIMWAESMAFTRAALAFKASCRALPDWGYARAEADADAAFIKGKGSAFACEVPYMVAACFDSKGGEELSAIGEERLRMQLSFEARVCDVEWPFASADATNAIELAKLEEPAFAIAVTTTVDY